MERIEKGRSVGMKRIAIPASAFIMLVAVGTILFSGENAAADKAVVDKAPADGKTVANAPELVKSFEEAFPDHGVDFAEGRAELGRLCKRFGPEKSSWHFEEWLIRDYFDGKRDGVFVDVGAWQYRTASNTYALEIDHGWSGIAIDAQEKFREGYEKNRKRTKFFCNFVSDKSTGKKEFFVPEESAMASGVIKNKGAGKIEETLQVLEITLDDLLDREGVKKVDFLTMDIELSEPAALRGFDIKRFQPALVCIEVVVAAGPEFSAEIHGYFTKNGYTKNELWSRIDSHNSYYVPASSLKDG